MKFTVEQLQQAGYSVGLEFWSCHSVEDNEELVSQTTHPNNTTQRWINGRYNDPQMVPIESIGADLKMPRIRLKPKPEDPYSAHRIAMEARGVEGSESKIARAPAVLGFQVQHADFI